MPHGKQRITLADIWKAVGAGACLGHSDCLLQLLLAHDCLGLHGHPHNAAQVDGELAHHGDEEGWVEHRGERPADDVRSEMSELPDTVWSNPRASPGCEAGRGTHLTWLSFSMGVAKLKAKEATVRQMPVEMSCSSLLRDP